ncbi:e3 ubiquitin-protein ligase [Gigaspora margarita]|uniref:E3 ubiquitin-protein ligase n=1 Tax=Gigaspora margarita TaxID=4874 RepID=A0A8H4A533_GIGMA|nr:e3 ubiquitin-protein ligase [Gigaspora margarita]
MQLLNCFCEFFDVRGVPWSGAGRHTILGYIYVIVDYVKAIRCPGCKNDITGVANHTSAAVNRRLDDAPITRSIKSKDQPGYANLKFPIAVMASSQSMRATEADKFIE